MYASRTSSDATRRIVEAASKANASACRSRSGTFCPQCGEREDIQDNGAKGDERTFRCEVCDEQWDVFLGRED